MTITCLVCMAGSLFASDDDPFTRKSRAETDLYGSGYLASTAAKSDAVMRQDISKQASLETSAADTNKKTADKVTEGAMNKVAPELKKKTSSGGSVDGERIAAGGATPMIIDPTNPNINIGVGTDQRDANNTLVSESGKKMVSEVINGIRYVYAGFDNDRVGNISINKAVVLAKSGDKVILRGGQYYAHADGDYYIGYVEQKHSSYGLNIINGVNLYGGYNDDGIRDLASNPTVINGQIVVRSIANPVKLDGITVDTTNINPSPGFSRSYASALGCRDSKNVTVVNSTFIGWYAAAIGAGAHVSFYNNTFISYSSSYVIAVASHDKVSAIYNPGVTASVVSSNNNYIGGSGVAAYDQGSFLSEHDYFNISKGPSYKTVTWSGGSATLTDETLTTNMPLSQTLISTDTGKATTKTAQYFSTRFFPAQYKRRELDDKYLWDNIFSKVSGKPVDPNLISAIAKTLAQNMKAGGKDTGADAAAKAVNDALIAAGIVRDVNPEAAALAEKLADLFSRATGEDKALLDSFKALLDTVNTINDQAKSEELTKAENDYATVVAAIFLAQSIPDLMREGDALAIRSIFADAATVKNTLVTKYQDAIAPYYDEMKKDIVKNAVALKARGVLAETLTADAILKLTPTEIDRIVKLVTQIKNPSSDERALLARESALRTLYITPNLVILEQGMRLLLKDCTQALYSILYERGTNKDMVGKPLADAVKQ